MSKQQKLEALLEFVSIGAFHGTFSSIGSRSRSSCKYATRFLHTDSKQRNETRVCNGHEANQIGKCIKHAASRG